jgi:hypothetical protein
MAASPTSAHATHTCCHGYVFHLCSSTPHHVGMVLLVVRISPPTPNHADMHAPPNYVHPPETMLPWLNLPYMRIHPKPCWHGCISHLCTCNPHMLSWLRPPPLLIHPTPWWHGLIVCIAPSTQHHAAMCASPNYVHPPETMLPWSNLPYLHTHPKTSWHGCIYYMLPSTSKPCGHGCTADMVASPISAQPPHTIRPCCIAHLCPSTTHRVGMAASYHICTSTRTPCCQGCIPVMTAYPISAHSPQTMLRWLHLPPLRMHPTHAAMAASTTSAHPPHTMLAWPRVRIYIYTPNHAAISASPNDVHPPETMLPWLNLPYLHTHPKTCCHGCIYRLLPSTL